MLEIEHQRAPGTVIEPGSDEPVVAASENIRFERKSRLQVNSWLSELCFSSGMRNWAIRDMRQSRRRTGPQCQGQIEMNPLASVKLLQLRAITGQSPGPLSSYVQIDGQVWNCCRIAVY